MSSRDEDFTRRCPDENINSANTLETPTEDAVVLDDQRAAQTSTTTCCWKNCKKVIKNNEGWTIRECQRPGCKRAVHSACVANMLSTFGASSAFTRASCGKRCYNALVKLPNISTTQTKKRVPWHNDAVLTFNARFC